MSHCGNVYHCAMSNCRCRCSGCRTQMLGESSSQTLLRSLVAGVAVRGKCDRIHIYLKWFKYRLTSYTYWLIYCITRPIIYAWRFHVYFGITSCCWSLYLLVDQRESNRPMRSLAELRVSMKSRAVDPPTPTPEAAPRAPLPRLLRGLLFSAPLPEITAQFSVPAAFINCHLMVALYSFRQKVSLVKI